MRYNDVRLRNILRITITIIFIAVSAIAGVEKVQFNVKYLSAGYVYIDGGKTDGLAVGDTIQVIRDNTAIGSLIISFTADHSSSCALIDSTLDVKAGDIVSASIVKPDKPDSTKTIIDLSESEVGMQSTRKEKRPRGGSGTMKGRISLGYFGWNDISANNLDFNQPGMSAKINIGDIWGSGYDLNIRTRARYNRRTRSYPNSVSQNEFRNRIYEFSLGRVDDIGFDIVLGRIIPRDVSGVGFLDGVLIGRRLSTSFKSGIFLGAQPGWQYAEPQIELQKYGFYLSYKADRNRATRFSSTIAIVGEYHYWWLSREFAHIDNRLNLPGGLSIYQMADIDFNREWRREKAGSQFSLTNLYFSARKRISSRITAGLNFDNRKRYWNYEQQSVADSLFDDLTRRGLKAILSLKLPSNLHLNTNFGFTGREGTSHISKSYSGTLSKTRITRANFTASFAASGFTNQFSGGMRLAYDLGWYSRRGDYLSFGYGLYRYKYNSTKVLRSSRWLQWKVTLRLTNRFVLSGDIQKSTGDDINGVTLMGDLSYSFR